MRDPIADSRGGVLAAIACGTSLAFSAISPGWLGSAVFFCAYMIIDALATPD